MKWRVVLAPRALETLEGVLNRRLGDQLAQHLSVLGTDPEEKGWPLAGELKGYRSFYPEGGWFRIVFRVVPGAVEVVLISLGQNRARAERDLRSLARTLFSERLLDSPGR